jgi:hypothetical protein
LLSSKIIEINGIKAFTATAVGKGSLLITKKMIVPIVTAIPKSRLARAL